MLQFLDQLPFPVLIVVTIFMLLAPFHPMPHVVEKIIMLKNGQLHRPIDIFDLVFHLTPLLLLTLKWWLSQGRP
ncbi:MAG: RND transporter [Desulfobulbaceae bacterium]|nr:RND transporter [Desulfobulbaceae bacterium]HIJ89612.1 RND transporter [Deltaproteobacteria bacterium]